jgi:hypothetical protein
MQMETRAVVAPSLMLFTVTVASFPELAKSVIVYVFVFPAGSLATR